MEEEFNRDELAEEIVDGPAVEKVPDATAVNADGSCGSYKR